MKKLLALLSMPLITSLSGCNKYKVGENTFWVDKGYAGPIEIIRNDSAIAYHLNPFSDKMASIKLKIKNRDGKWGLGKNLEGKDFDRENLRFPGYAKKIDSIRSLQKILREK